MTSFKHIEKCDYHDYIKIIDSNITKEKYNYFIDNTLGNKHVIILLKNESNIIGAGTLFIEEKMTYGGCKMGHIENIIVDGAFRHNGYGEKIVNELLSIAKEKRCYRVDLNCTEELKSFYQKNNFEKKHICMNVYFRENFLLV